MIEARRQGPGISSEIETRGGAHRTSSLRQVGRGLASHLRLKQVDGIGELHVTVVGRGLASHLRLKRERDTHRDNNSDGRQGPGISSEIETTTSLIYTCLTDLSAGAWHLI